MATQSRLKRQTAAKKAAATRKTNAAKRSASTTKGSARRTTRSAKSSARSGATTAKQAARTTGHGLDAATTRIDALGRQAQRAVMIQLGAAIALRDAVSQIAETYSNLDRALLELNRFERRGEAAVRRGKQTLRRRRRGVEHDVRSARRGARRQADGIRSEAGEVVERITSVA